MIKNGDEKTHGHIDYWIGEVIGEFHANFGHNVCSLNTPGFFASLAEIVAKSRVSNTLTCSNWNIVTNRVLYQQQIMSFPLTKVERDLGSTLSASWRRIYVPVISSPTREVLFLAIHVKLPVKEAVQN